MNRISIILELIGAGVVFLVFVMLIGIIFENLYVRQKKKKYNRKGDDVDV